MPCALIGETFSVRAFAAVRDFETRLRVPSFAIGTLQFVEVNESKDDADRVVREVLDRFDRLDAGLELCRVYSDLTFLGSVRDHNPARAIDAALDRDHEVEYGTLVLDTRVNRRVSRLLFTHVLHPTGPPSAFPP